MPMSFQTSDTKDSLRSDDAVGMDIDVYSVQISKIFGL